MPSFTLLHEITPARTHANVHTCASVCPTTDVCITGHADGMLILWQWMTWTRIASVAPRDPDDVPIRVQWAPDGRSVLVLTRSRRAFVLEIDRLEMHHVPQLEAAVWASEARASSDAPAATAWTFAHAHTHQGREEVGEAGPGMPRVHPIDPPALVSALEFARHPDPLPPPADGASEPVRVCVWDSDMCVSVWGAGAWGGSTPAGGSSTATRTDAATRDIALSKLSSLCSGLPGCTSAPSLVLDRVINPAPGRRAVTDLGVVGSGGGRERYAFGTMRMTRGGRARGRGGRCVAFSSDATCVLRLHYDEDAHTARVVLTQDRTGPRPSVHSAAALASDAMAFAPAFALADACIRHIRRCIELTATEWAAAMAPAAGMLHALTAKITQAEGARAIAAQERHARAFYPGRPEPVALMELYRFLTVGTTSPAIGDWFDAECSEDAVVKAHKALDAAVTAVEALVVTRFARAAETLLLTLSYLDSQGVHGCDTMIAEVQHAIVLAQLLRSLSAHGRAVHAAVLSWWLHCQLDWRAKREELSTLQESLDALTADEELLLRKANPAGYAAKRKTSTPAPRQPALSQEEWRFIRAAIAPMDVPHALPLEAPSNAPTAQPPPAVDDDPLGLGIASSLDTTAAASPPASSTSAAVAHVPGQDTSCDPLLSYELSALLHCGAVESTVAPTATTVCKCRNLTAQLDILARRLDAVVAGCCASNDSCTETDVLQLTEVFTPAADATVNVLADGRIQHLACIASSTDDACSVTALRIASPLDGFADVCCWRVPGSAVAAAAWCTPVPFNEAANDLLVEASPFVQAQPGSDLPQSLLLVTAQTTVESGTVLELLEIAIDDIPWVRSPIDGVNECVRHAAPELDGIVRRRRALPATAAQAWHRSQGESGVRVALSVTHARGCAVVDFPATGLVLVIDLGEDEDEGASDAEGE